MDDLNAFVNEKLHFLSDNCLEQLVGDENVNVEEILSGNLAAVSGHIVEFEVEGTVVPEVDQGRTTFVCPGLTSSANVEGISCEVFSRERDEVDGILREKLGGSRVT